MRQTQSKAYIQTLDDYEHGHARETLIKAEAFRAPREAEPILREEIGLSKQSMREIGYDY